MIGNFVLRRQLQATADYRINDRRKLTPTEPSPAPVRPPAPQPKKVLDFKPDAKPSSARPASPGSQAKLMAIQTYKDEMANAKFNFDSSKDFGKY
jgi:hypothetical protein